jgi:hypothetical protein
VVSGVLFQAINAAFRVSNLENRKLQGFFAVRRKNGGDACAQHLDKVDNLFEVSSAVVPNRLLDRRRGVLLVRYAVMGLPVLSTVTCGLVLRYLRQPL